MLRAKKRLLVLTLPSPKEQAWLLGGETRRRAFSLHGDSSPKCWDYGMYGGIRLIDSQK
jgi:hypothetical protein